MSRKVLVAIDAPDPDNLALLRVAQTMFGADNILGVLLTGRPINFKATKETPIEEWDYNHSRTALLASAARLKNFLRGYGNGTSLEVFDGGIAPRTLVPHWLHFLDYYRFLDVDPLQAICVPELDSLEKLALILSEHNFDVLVGGPMTGLARLLQRFPELHNYITSVHAMYATLGNVDLMNFGDKPRGAKQFNVACDPFAGRYVTEALDCPFYFVTSDCTRQDAIGFATPTMLRQHLADTPGNKRLVDLYTIWFANAVEPRKEIIYIHDVCSAVSASPFRNEVYEFTPMRITSFPHLPGEKDDWGKIEFVPDANSNIHVATALNSPKKYLNILKTNLK